MYDYLTPDGYGDTFFIYNVNGEDIPIVNGNSYSLLGVPVQDGMFVCRAWSGGALLVNVSNGTVQMYDGVRNSWFQLPILQGNFPPSIAVLPEKVYRDNSALRFDLTNVSLKTNNNGSNQVYADQMAWYGAKRTQGNVSDPMQSSYKYYEKPFAYPITLTLTNYGPSSGGLAIPGLAAPTQYTIQIQDYDFELRRIGLSTSGKSINNYASPFKILLYDATWRQRMTVPIISELICHNASNLATPSSMPNNVWPSPPMMYPVNSVIRFDIFSLIPGGDSLPVTVNLTFEGVRRINC
jgi:hypothetical protein